jgi:hypothetical protein
MIAVGVQIEINIICCLGSLKGSRIHIDHCTCSSFHAIRARLRQERLTTAEDRRTGATENMAASHPQRKTNGNVDGCVYRRATAATSSSHTVGMIFLVEQLEEYVGHEL